VLNDVQKDALGVVLQKTLDVHLKMEEYMT
jgi:hypothetical protein